MKGKKEDPIIEAIKKSHKNPITISFTDDEILQSKQPLQTDKETIHEIILRKIEEKEIISEEMEKVQPLVEEGLKRKKQLHARKDKKNKYVMKYCLELMEKNQSSSALQLMLRFPTGEEKAVVIDGAKLFKEAVEAGETKIFCIMPNGQRRPIGERSFSDYFKKAKEILNVNS